LDRVNHYNIILQVGTSLFRTPHLEGYGNVYD